MTHPNGRGTRFYSRLIADNTALQLQAVNYAERESDLVQIIQEKNRLIEAQREFITLLEIMLRAYTDSFPYLYSQAFNVAYRGDVA